MSFHLKLTKKLAGHLPIIAHCCCARCNVGCCVSYLLSCWLAAGVFTEKAGICNGVGGLEPLDTTKPPQAMIIDLVRK
jgi:hypothetical protein